MPKKVFETYTKNDINMMPIYAGMLLYGVMRDYTGFSDDNKRNLLRQISDMKIMQTNPDLIHPIYQNLYPDLAGKYEGKYDYMTANEQLSEDTKTVENKNKNYYVNKDKANGEFFTEAVEEPIQGMVDGMKIVSQHLDKYIKTAKLSQAEKDFLNAYKLQINDYANGKSHIDTIAKNPAMMVNDSLLGAMLNLPNFTASYEENKKTEEIDLKIKGDFFNKSWKDTVLAIEHTPIFDTIIKGAEVQRKLEAHEKGDATTADLIQAYEEYADAIGKMVNMPEDEFNKIHRSGALQNNYDNFVLGSRTPHYAFYDAQAKAQLLKAGYTLEDAIALSSYYTNMMEAKRVNDLLSPEKQSPIVNEEFEKMSKIWEKVVAPNQTEASRKENMGAVIDSLKYMDEGIKSGKFKDTTLNNSSLQQMIKDVEKRRDIELTPDEKLKLSGDVEALYNYINSNAIDKGYIKSSSEFKKMKSDLKKLAEFDKKKSIAKYELLKANAIKSTQAYLRYKNKELNSSKGHKRKDYEMGRVNAANAVLDRLTTIDRMDFEESLKTDKRFVVNDDMSYQNARAFIKSEWVMDQGRKHLFEALDNWKAILVNTQGLENKEKNFENKEETLGSDEYVALTQALQDCMDKLKDEKTLPTDLKRSMSNLKAAADKYHDTHKGLIFGPGSGKGQTRLEISEQIKNTMPDMIYAYDNMRRQFEPCRDEKGVSYKNKSYAEIKEQSEKFLEMHKDQFIKDRQIHPDKIYENMFKASGMQRKLIGAMKSKNPFMASKFRTNNKPDHYLAIKEGQSIDEMAKNYVTLDYLTKMTRVGIKPSELKEIADDLKAGNLEKEAKQLAKNPVFKAVCKSYPEKAFSKWEAVERKADKVQQMCRDSIEELLNSNPDGKYENAEDYINSVLGVGDEVGKVMAYQIISSKGGRLIAQAIAADNKVDAQAEINSFVEKADSIVKDYYKKTPAKDRLMPEELMNDPGFKEKMQSELIGAEKVKIKQQEEAVKQNKRHVQRKASEDEIMPLGI